MRNDRDRENETPRGSRGRRHVDEFLHREEQEIERLRRDFGRDVVGRLDRRLLREILRDRRLRAMDEMFGIDSGAGRHEVVVALRRGEAVQEAPARDDSERKVRIEKLRRSSALATERLARSMENEGVKLEDRFWIVPATRASVTTDQLRKLAMRGDVSSIVSNKPHLATCLNASRPLIQADQVAALGFTGANVTVAVLDTGVDITHPALAGVVTSQVDMTATGGGPAEGIGDFVGHGTHCAGIVASQDGTFRGIAPGARIADVKMMWNNGIGGGVTNAAVAVNAIQTAVGLARVSSNSWGFSHADGNWADPPAPGQPDGTCVLCAAANAATAAGQVFVVAAGNEDNDSCATYDTHIRCPGLARSTITIAASDTSDNMAGFSSVGPTPDGNAKPDLTAPGVNIASCLAAGTTFGPDIGGGFTRADGTSMACPHVAGVAALMISKTNGLTPATVKTILMTTTVDLGAPTNQQGTGRVDALAAVNAS
jgi:serine protease AprX